MAKGSSDINGWSVTTSPSVGSSSMLVRLLLLVAGNLSDCLASLLESLVSLPKFNDSYNRPSVLLDIDNLCYES